MKRNEFKPVLMFNGISRGHLFPLKTCMNGYSNSTDGSRRSQ